MLKGEKELALPAAIPNPWELALGNAVELARDVTNGADGGGEMKRGGGGDIV